MTAKVEFITASAGSGKTHRLVDIVSEAIRRCEARPQGIVATTFTIAAATELRERLAANLHALGRSEEATLLGAGMIGTVHSICLDLLKRFPLEAGVSPDLAVLDEAQTDILRSRAFDSVLTEKREGELVKLSDRLGLCDARTSSHPFRNHIPQIAGEARINNLDMEELPRMGAASWEEMKAAWPEPTNDDLEGLLAKAIQGALREIDPESTVKTVQDYRHLLEQSARAQAKGRLDWGEWQKLSTAEPGKAKKNAHIAPPVQEIAGRLGEHPRFHEDNRRYLALLFETARELAQAFGDLKREHGTVDFNDLEKETLDLLTASQEVRALLKQEIDLLVVDEFQDTSPLQLALFGRLAECAKRVVWVGDVKQAIYGFRGSDPELIMAAAATATPEAALETSWRSTPGLVGFANAVFQEPFQRLLDLPSAQVTLQPHRASHPEAGPSLRIAYITTGEIQQNGKKKRLNNGDCAAPLADAVKAFLEAGEQVVDKSSISATERTGSLRPVEARDIGVLVRNNESAAKIARELRSRGIEVSLSTTGLIALPECQLALACLRVLTDPDDSLACAEVIAFEAEHAPETWLKDRLDHLARKAESGLAPSATWGTDESLRSPTLTSLCEARDSCALSGLSPLALYDLAQDRADVARLAASWGPHAQRAERRLANLSRLREFIEEYQETAQNSGMAATLPGLFAWLESLTGDHHGLKARDEEPVDPEINAVHVGTYHKAKGLEWPVVFATDLDHKTRSRLFSLRPHRTSEKFDPAQPLAGRELRLWIEPPGKAKSALTERLVQTGTGGKLENAAKAEDLRLLYVGMTRARDTLVLVHDSARPADWLELAANPEAILRPETSPIVLGGQSFPCVVTTHTLQPDHPRVTPEREIEVPRRDAAPVPGLPFLLTPSECPAHPAARVSEVVEFGSRLILPSGIDPRDLGDAVHRIIAAEIRHPRPADRTARAARLLRHWGLQALNAGAVLQSLDAYRKWVQERFSPSEELTEVPFTFCNPEGQQASGFIDHLLHTTSGPVILDHKVNPAGRDRWEAVALSYSGQLHLYQQVVASHDRSAAPAACWIHLFTTGAALRVESAAP